MIPDRDELIDRHGFKKCPNCGTLTDGDVCSVSCELSLIEAKHAQHAHERSAAGMHDCDWCGGGCACGPDGQCQGCTPACKESLQ